MSKREQTINVFNKNHITITKTINCYDSAYAVSMSSKSFSIESSNEPYMKLVKKESPLGFYYTCREYKQRNSSSYRQSTELKIHIGNTKYSLLYFTSYSGYNVNYDKRPWELHPDDENFDDHYIYDLENEVKKLFNLIDENSLKITFDENLSKEYQTKIMVDLFGHKNGYMKQTNSEKILSHGFDLKTSFRKM